MQEPSAKKLRTVNVFMVGFIRVCQLLETHPETYVNTNGFAKLEKSSAPRCSAFLETRASLRLWITFQSTATCRPLC
jgi:hypothetical protein